MSWVALLIGSGIDPGGVRRLECLALATSEYECHLIATLPHWVLLLDHPGHPGGVFSLDVMKSKFQVEFSRLCTLSSLQIFQKEG